MGNCYSCTGCGECKAEKPKIVLERCVVCGKPVFKTDDKCASCGAPVAHEESAEATSQASGPGATD